jgi:hypothetical protein
VDEELRPQRVRGRRQGDTQSLPIYLDNLAHECRSVYLKEALFRWQELRALEIVWDEIGSEFDGEEIISTENRGQINEAKDLLGAVLADCGRKARPPEPRAEYVEHYRAMVKNVIRMFGLQETQ